MRKEKFYVVLRDNDSLFGRKVELVSGYLEGRWGFYQSAAHWYAVDLATGLALTFAPI